MRMMFSMWQPLAYPDPAAYAMRPVWLAAW